MESPIDGTLRRALDSLLEGCQVIDHEYRYLYVNRAAAQHGRTSVEALRGRTMMEAYPGIEGTEMFSVLREALTTRRARRMDNEFVFPDGGRGWFRLSFEPVDAGLFVLSVDITERVEAERAFRESDARHRALLRGLPDIVFLVGPDGRIRDLHAQEDHSLPAPLDELRGRAISELLPGEAGPLVDAALRTVATTERPLTVRYALELTGGTRHFETVIVPLADGCRTLVARDVTDRQNLEAQLRQAQKMEAIGQLTGGIAHDFNNVLTIIGSNAELLAGGDLATAAHQREIEEILTATRRGADMIGQLLRFSRRGMLARRLLEPAAVIREFGGMLQRLLPASVRLEIVAATTDRRVMLDPGALEQVLANLCTNARDAMPDGGTLTVECEPAYLDEGYHASHPWVAPGDYVCVSVSDTGVGMDEATRQRIFEPFFTTKPAGVGTGLGMAMVYGMMKEHAGMVHVYSEPGRGTVVKLYFPVADATQEAAVEVRPVPPPVAGGSETILLVEDDAAIRRASRRALEGRGYRILEAADGEQALEVFHEHRARIALVISDLVMPNLGGRQLAEALRRLGAEVPIVFTSGYSAADAYREGRMPTGVRFLHKPWTLADLFSVVRSVIDGGTQETTESGHSA